MADDLLLEQERRESGRVYDGNELAYLREVLESGRLSSLNGGTFVPRLEAEFSSISVGYTSKPAYKHPLIENRRAHAFTRPENQGHSGRYDEGTCPVSEHVIPRLILGYVVEGKEKAKREAEKLHGLICRLQES